MADHTYLGDHNLHHSLTLEDIELLVTDREAPATILGRFHNEDGQGIIAPIEHSEPNSVISGFKGH